VNLNAGQATGAASTSGASIIVAVSLVPGAGSTTGDLVTPSERRLASVSQNRRLASVSQNRRLASATQSRRLP
jgi:hypothetical protein